MTEHFITFFKNQEQLVTLPIKIVMATPRRETCLVTLRSAFVMATHYELSNQDEKYAISADKLLKDEFRQTGLICMNLPTELSLAPEDYGFRASPKTPKLLSKLRKGEKHFLVSQVGSRCIDPSGKQLGGLVLIRGASDEVELDKTDFGKLVSAEDESFLGMIVGISQDMKSAYLANVAEFCEAMDLRFVEEEPDEAEEIPSDLIELLTEINCIEEINKRIQETGQAANVEFTAQFLFEWSMSADESQKTMVREKYSQASEVVKNNEVALIFWTKFGNQIGIANGH